MSKIQYSYNYKLQLDSKGFQGADAVVLQNDRSLTVSYNNISMTMSLYGVTFRRKVYEPGCIQAEILIQTDESNLPTVDLLTTMLIRRPVSLFVEKSHYAAGEKTVDSSTSVAKNYYIHEISPQFEKRKTRVEVQGDGGTTGQAVTYYWIYTKLDIYSIDKLMTLSKYSQAHFGRTLFGDILDENIGSFVLRYQSTAASQTTNTVSISTDTRTLYHLVYKIGDKTEELVQPYLVQYNESFYDFLRRTANRCGEVFYFEDGKFCVGVSASDSTPIEDASRIIFQRISEGALNIRTFARDSLKEWDAENETYMPKDENDVLRDPVATGKDKFPTDAFPETDASNYKIHPYSYNSEIASEDHYVALYKDKFAHDSVNDLWCGDDAEHTLRTLALVLRSTSLMELLTNFGLKEMEAAAKAASKAKDTTDKWNKVVKDLSLATKDDDKTSAVIPQVDDRKDGHWITLDYVNDIRANEEAQMRGMVCVDMGTGFSDVKLGDKITLPHDSRIYVVVQIDMSSGKEWQRSYDGYDSGEPAPKEGQSQRIYAIPMTGTAGKEVFYPPLLPGDPFRRSGAQPAFVIDNKDPVGQGRVRVRYPWQPHYEESYDDIKVSDKESATQTAKDAMDAAETELEKYAEDIVIPETGDPTARMIPGKDEKEYKAALNKLKDKVKAYRTAKIDQTVAEAQSIIKEAGSPWIRIATPMATSGGGMFFCPEKGDEVMVDFENGNVERPYVTGTLFSKNVPAPKEGSRVIVSKNGHTIKMSDPGNSTDVLATILPFFKMLTMYGAKVDGLDGEMTRAMGGIELTDQLGFYNIKMSSHDRLISISSPFGNVNISAFTGITIDAPNGDISITGKNIDLTAYNKITMNSGKNIKLRKDQSRGGFWTAGDSWNEVGKQIGKSIPKLFGLSKWFDLSLYRTLIEVVVRPIDGTFEIKSQRFMKLEAGEGGTAFDTAHYEDRWTDQVKHRREVQVLGLLLAYIKDTVDAYTAAFISKFNEVQTTFDHIKAHFTGAHPNITRPANAKTLLTQMFGLDHTAIGDEKKMTQVRADYVFNEAKVRIPIRVGSRAKVAIWGQLNLLLDAVLALKAHILDYDHLFDKVKKPLWDRSKAPISKWGTLEQAKAIFRLPKMGLGTAAQNVLKMDNPTMTAAALTQVHTNITAETDQATAALATPAAIQVPNPAAEHASVAGVKSGLFGVELTEVKKFIDNHAPDETIFDAALLPNAYDTWKKFICRRLAVLVIEKCRQSNPFAHFSIPAAAYLPRTVPGDPASGTLDTYHTTAPIQMGAPYADEDFQRYVDDIHLAYPDNNWSSDLGAGILDGLMESTKKILPFESDVWKPEAKGKILLSDQKGKTFRFADGGSGQTESYDNVSLDDTWKEADFNELKRVLGTF